MASENINVIQKCGLCDSHLGSFEVKKDNLMLLTKNLIWCPNCCSDVQETRDISGRVEAIDNEQETYPRADIY